MCCVFFKPSEKSRHCITNRIMWKHLHCWKTEGNEPVGWIYFYHLFYFLMKETCPSTFKSLSLQRKTASLIDPCEMVVTLMKYRIKLHFFFCTWFHLHIWKYPVLHQKRTLSCCILLSHSPSRRCRNSGREKDHLVHQHHWWFNEIQYPAVTVLL